MNHVLLGEPGSVKSSESVTNGYMPWVVGGKESFLTQREDDISINNAMAGLLNKCRHKTIYGIISSLSVFFISFFQNV